ncbi:MAG: hypothetical protein ACOX47_05645 [Bacillota bacterium]|jgi:hypothetical protein
MVEISKNEVQGFSIKYGRTTPLDTNCLEESLRSIQSNGNNVIDERVAIEFFCGGCCKRLSNAAIVIVLFDIIVIALAAEGECLLVETLCEGKLVDKELSNFALLDPDRVCSFEFYVPGQF